MLEIRSDDLKNAVVTDVEYHVDTGEILTLWVRMWDKRLVSVYPDHEFHLMSCPWSEDFHGKPTWVVVENPDVQSPIDNCLTGAIITDVGCTSDGRLFTLYMQLPDKRFIMVSPMQYKMIASECPPDMAELHGGVRTTGDLIRTRIQTPGELAGVLCQYAKDWTKEGSLEFIIRNGHMNKCRDFTVNPRDQDLVDAAVVGFINYVAMQYCMDYGLYTRDLYEERKNGVYQS